MTVVDIGVRELQRETSRVIHEVETRGTAFRVKVQGRPTSVVVSREARRHSGATLDQLLESSIYKDKSPELVAAQLAELDTWRDAVGYVGQTR